MMTTEHYTATNLHATAIIQKNYDMIEQHKELLDNMYDAACHGKFHYEALWPLDGDFIDWLYGQGYKVCAENDYGKRINLRSQCDREPGYTKYSIWW